jgi:hypothetical protein
VSIGDWLVNDLVIGSCLRSVLYSKLRGATLLFNKKARLRFFDDEYKLWNEEVFKLSVAGQVPFGESINSIRITNNTAFVSYGRSCSKKIKFKKCYVFDDNLLMLENALLRKEIKKSKVIDWIDIKKCANLENTSLFTGDDFVSKVIPYKSGRVYANLDHRDLVVVSYLSESQLQDFDYSDTMCKFKTRDFLEQSGAIGTVNRVDSATGKVFRNRIDLNVTRRDVECMDKNIYESSKWVKFPKTSLKSILEKLNDREG